MRDARPSISMLVALMLLMTTFSTHFSVLAESDDCDDGLACEWLIPDSGSNVIVVQEITAIWCEICAVTDPKIMQFTNQRHEEVTRIAYHPHDGVDYLGNRLSTHQMWNLGQNPTEAEFPTLWMDGTHRASGPTSESQLHKTYLKAAGQRTSNDGVQIEYYNRGNNSSDQNRLEFIATTSGVSAEVITLVLTNNRVEIDNPEAYNGVRYHDDVATAGVIVNAYNGSIVFSEPSDAWEVISWNREENVSNLKLYYNYSVSSTGNDDELLKQKGMIVFTENSAGKVIAAQQIQSANRFYEDENNSILILAGIALVGLLLATPALKEFNVPNTNKKGDPSAESEE